MEGFRTYLEKFGRIQETTFAKLKVNYQQTNLSEKEIFSKEGEYARKIGFLEKGIVRAFIRDEEGFRLLLCCPTTIYCHGRSDHVTRCITSQKDSSSLNFF